MKYYVENSISKIDLGDELLLSIDDNKVISLKDTSKFIFELIEKGYDFEKILSEFVKNYTIDFGIEILKQDILECIDEFINQKVVRSVNNE
jgi:hypothetical protein